MVSILQLKWSIQYTTNIQFTVFVSKRFGFICSMSLINFMATSDSVLWTLMSYALCWDSCLAVACNVGFNWLSIFFHFLCVWYKLLMNCWWILFYKKGLNFVFLPLCLLVWRWYVLDIAGGLTGTSKCITSRLILLPSQGPRHSMKSLAKLNTFFLIRLEPWRKLVTVDSWLVFPGNASVGPLYGFMNADSWLMFFQD